MTTLVFVHLYVTCLPSTYQRPEVLEFMELELQMVMGCHVGTRNWIAIFWISNQCHLTNFRN